MDAPRRAISWGASMSALASRCVSSASCKVLARRSSRHSAASRKPPFPASKPAGSTLASSAQRFWQPRRIAILPCWSSRVGNWKPLHNSSINRTRLLASNCRSNWLACRRLKNNPPSRAKGEVELEMAEISAASIPPSRPCHWTYPCSSVARPDRCRAHRRWCHASIECPTASR